MSTTDVLDDSRRDLRLEGAYNVRDLGGYRTADGRTVRWGRVYRSSALSNATPTDVSLLLSCGLRVVCDFRSGLERAAAPNAWLASTSIESWGLLATEAVGDSQGLLANCLVSAEATREVMTQTYRQIPFDQAPAYGHAFGRLVRGETPLLFHCSAGKDRSGVASALLLHAVGVPRETAFADYLLSNRVREQICAAFVADPRHAAAARDPTRAWLPLISADPVYLAAMFDEIDRRCGGTEGYFAAHLGIGPDELARLRACLLE